MRLRLVIVLVLLPLVAGCSETSFVGRQFDNFTAYYNKFYNAQDLFETEMRKLEDQSVAVDRTRYLPIFPLPEASGNQNLQAVVTKSADVLRTHPNSRWVDDALLLIGKSYFFQQNFVGAEQKFREVMELGTGLEDEARFWLARSLTATDAAAEAIDHIETSLLQQEELDERWAARLHLVRGDLAVRGERWEEAAEEITLGLEEVRDNDLAARAEFALGQVYETLERYEDAAAAYRRVNEHRPVFELSYAALVSEVRVEGLYGDAERALSLLRRMERDDKYYEDRAELQYMRGRIYQRQGLADAAFVAFDELLYVSDANISSVRGATHYALGELLRDDYLHYIRAAAHFDTAATALRTQQEEDVLYTPAAITDSRDVADVFKSFATVQGRIEEADSLLNLGQMDDEAFDEYVMQLRRAKAEELEEQREQQERARSQRRFNNARSVEQRGLQNRNEAETAGGAAETASSESGFLYHRSAQQVREAQRGFVQQWGRRPHVPNWRRMQAVSATAEEQDGSEEQVAQLELLDEVGEELPEVDVSAVPRDSASFQEVRRRRAVARYELGNVLFIQMSQPDSAATWYRRVVQEDADQPVAGRALYALAEVQRAMGDETAARRLQREVVNRYPTSELAVRLRAQIDASSAEAVVPDTTALAEAAYATAYERWQTDDYEAALEAMADVAVTYERTDVAPRALLAVASIILERARRDSLDVLAPVDVNLPDTLLVQLGVITPAVTPGDGAASDTALAAQIASAGPDSLTAGGEQPVPDSVAAADSLMQPDAVAVSDSTAPPADSLVMAPDAAQATPTAVQPEPQRPAPARFFAALTERYPEAPQAERAEQILRVLREREEAARAYADSVAAAQQAVADSIAAAQQPAPAADSLGQAADSTDVPGVEPRIEAAAGDSTVVPAGGAPDSTAVEPSARTQISPEQRQTLIDGEPRPLAPPDSAVADSVRAREILP